MASLDRNYYTRVIDENTFIHKKHYDSNIFVIFPTHNFVIKKNNSNPHFTCFIKQKGEQFGDSLPVETLADAYIIRVYDIADNVIVNGIMTSMDIWLGEYQYEFSKFDLNSQGVLSCEIIEVEGIDKKENVIGKCKINVI